MLILEGGICQTIAKRPLNLRERHRILRIAVAHGLVKFRIGIADSEFCRWRYITIENVCHRMTTLLTRIPRLDDGSTTLGQSGNDLCTASEDHQNNGFSCCQQRFDIFLLLAWQSQSLTVAILATQHHILAYGSNDDVSRISHCQCFFAISLFAGIHLTMKDRILPRTLIAHMREFGLNLLRPVTTTTIHQRVALRQTVTHALQQRYHMRVIEVFLHPFPEERHSRERIIATHSPHRMGVGTRQQDAQRVALQRQNAAVVLQQDNALGGNLVRSLTLLRSIELDIALGIEVGLAVEHSCTELVTQHVLHSTFQRRWCHKTAIDSFLQETVVGTKREIDVITAVDG